ncbi:hypothetical protein V498_09976 [Pseudogymnoascus sp. VKM F-4517 (FW-2822)]|nr:hypothetical protein V498_09976 [Pseudogymnoascus sp. VKM F-4517 (FW-2822)]
MPINTHRHRTLPDPLLRPIRIQHHRLLFPSADPEYREGHAEGQRSDAAGIQQAAAVREDVEVAPDGPDGLAGEEA